MMLSKLATDALKYLAALHKSPHTLSAYSITFRQFEAHLTGTKGLADDCRHFSEETVMSFMVALHEDGANPNTIRARLSSLAFLAKYGARIRDGRGRAVVSGNPLAGVDRPKRKRPMEKWLAPEELAAFLSVPVPPYISIARDLLVDLALRVSELCALSWGEVIGIKGTYYVSVIAKGGNPARVPLSPQVAEKLHAWFVSRNMPEPVEPVLTDGHGRRLGRGRLSYMMVSIGRKAGIRRFPVTAHVLRHTMNVIRRQGGIDSMTRSALLTHTNPSSIIAYEHVDPSELVAARAQQQRALAAYLKNVNPSTQGELPA